MLDYALQIAKQWVLWGWDVSLMSEDFCFFLLQMVLKKNFFFGDQNSKLTGHEDWQRQCRKGLKLNECFISCQRWGSVLHLYSSFIPHNKPLEVRVSSATLWMRTFKFWLRHSLSKSQVRPRQEHNTKSLIQGRFADGDVEPSESRSAGGQQVGSPSWALSPSPGFSHLEVVISSQFALYGARACSFVSLLPDLGWWQSHNEAAAPWGPKSALSCILLLFCLEMKLSLLISLPRRRVCHLHFLRRSTWAGRSCRKQLLYGD